ncbi:hypothetical protein CCACVL1_00180 [Corchorus capsularis]|uniref:Uncharacterized protein n=1 Tax=Corchorus capsularis TaxID=210143 RepID=A0A1R3KY52_COCAP|nr:hypothetical protein CCACVL1_00180 [Corchorus capsularis]
MGKSKRLRRDGTSDRSDAA